MYFQMKVYLPDLPLLFLYIFLSTLYTKNENKKLNLLILARISSGASTKVPGTNSLLITFFCPKRLMFCEGISYCGCKLGLKTEVVTRCIVFQADRSLLFEELNEVNTNRMTLNEFQLRPSLIK